MLELLLSSLVHTHTHILPPYTRIECPSINTTTHTPTWTPLLSFPRNFRHQNKRANPFSIYNRPTWRQRCLSGHTTQQDRVYYVVGHFRRVYLPYRYRYTPTWMDVVEDGDNFNIRRTRKKKVLSDMGLNFLPESEYLLSHTSARTPSPFWIVNVCVVVWCDVLLFLWLVCWVCVSHYRWKLVRAPTSTPDR